MDEEVQNVPQPEEVASNDTDNEETLTNAEPQEELTEEAPIEQSTEPEEVISEDDEDEDGTLMPVSAPELQSPLLDFSQLPADENGNIDPNALAEALQQRDQAILKQAASMVQEQEDRRQEERQWQKAIEKFPELKKDKSLAEEVQALRFGLFASDIQAGKQSKLVSPAQAYQRLQKRFSDAQNAGFRQATANTRIEESVYVEPTSNASSASAEDSGEVFKRMRSPDRVEAERAGFEFLKNQLFGK